MSGTEQGSGGVGGLLAVRKGSQTYYPCYDGNGNITGYVSVNDEHAAFFKYDPFGKITYEWGDTQNFLYRFSTKPIDQTSKVYYYGYRYYDPEIGRWPSRDPIAEQGGLNLYGFVENDGIRSIDRFGLQEASPSTVVDQEENYTFLYSIGGTWERADDGANPSKLASAFANGSFHKGIGFTGDYQNPIQGLMGLNALQVRRKVHNEICREFCKNFECNPMHIYLSGWSRGAVTAVGVAHDLNDKGCNCKDRTIKPIPVAWMGLFDAVDRIAQPGRLLGGWPRSIPDNVLEFQHAVKTKVQPIFKTVNYNNGGRKKFPGNHSDIGYGQGAYNWIFNGAKNAGLKP